jgi:hypothetical protein
MTALESADYGVIGEGEITVNALAYALEHDRDPADLKGIICERDGAWVLHDKWDIIQDLDSLPFPDYLGFEYGQILNKSGKFGRALTDKVGSNRIAHIGIHRSCPYQCTFCFHICGNTYRQTSLDRIFQLIDWLVSLYPLDGLHMQTELMFADQQFALEFCRRIKPYNLRWICNTRADIPTEEMLIRAKESGCVQLLVGIESADNRILKSMRKGIRIEQVEKIFEFAHRIELSTVGNLIFGDPAETAESVQRSLEWWQRHRHWEVYLNCIKAYPGSHNYKTACAKGLIKDPVQFLKDGFPLVNLSKLTDDEYADLPSVIAMLQRTNSKIIHAVVEPLDDQRVNVFGICPYCKKHISFIPFASIINLTPQQCPVCGKSVSVNPSEYCDYDVLNKAATALIDGKNAAVWAVTLNNFYWLLQAMPCLQEENVSFINKYEVVVPVNGKVYKKSLWGKAICKPEVIDEKNIETIIVPNPKPVFQAIKAQCVRFPSVKKIVHITELLREKG